MSTPEIPIHCLSCPAFLEAQEDIKNLENANAIAEAVNNGQLDPNLLKLDNPEQFELDVKDHLQAARSALAYIAVKAIGCPGPEYIRSTPESSSSESELLRCRSPLN